MPGKKSDSKSKNVPEPEKGKKRKDDKKGARDNKKGGKDDKKKGKDEPSKGKGKDDGKKGNDKGKKEKVASESEDSEDAGLIDEEQELSEEEDHDSEGGTCKQGHGKSRKAKTKEKYATSDEEEEEEEDDEENEVSEDDRKGKKSAAASAKKTKYKPDSDGKKTRKKGEPLPEETPQETKDSSKHFLGFSGIGRMRSSKKRLKNTSRLFLRLGKQKNFLVRKKKRKSFFKNAPKLLMRFHTSRKKKKEKEKNNQSGSKSTYMLLKIGGTKPAEKKTGFFKGLFGKRNADDGSPFKNQSRLLGKVAGATNWLTKKFLSTKGRHRPLNRDQTSWRQTRTKRLPERRQQTSMRHPHWHHNYGYEHDSNYDLYRHPDIYEAQHGDYYDMQSQDQGNYYQGDELYDHQMGIQSGGKYYDESIGYTNTYSAENHLAYYPEDIEYYDPQQVMDPYYDDSMKYYDDSQYLMEDNYELYENETEFYEQGQFHYDDDPQYFYADPCGEVSSYGVYDEPYLYQVNYNEAGVTPYVESSCNIYEPYGCTFPEFMESDMVGDVSVEPTVYHQDMFKVPRPQVKLFGKERIAVVRTPSPPRYNLEENFEFQTESEPYIHNAHVEGAFPVPVHLEEMLHPAVPQIPTPTAMLIKHANSPYGFVSPIQHSQHMSPVAQSTAYPQSPSPSRRSVGLTCSLVQRPISSLAAPEEFGQMQQQNTHVNPQLSFSSVRQNSSPSQTTTHGFRARHAPPSPKLTGTPSSNNHVKCPPYPLGLRNVSPTTSPVLTRHLYPQASFIEARQPHPPMGLQMFSQGPSPLSSPPASMFRSISKQSPSHSTHASIRRTSPSSSPERIHHSFGVRKVQGSPSRKMSPPISPRTSMQSVGTIKQVDANRYRASPTASRKSFAVGSKSPIEHRSSSPSPSHRFTPLVRDQPLFGSASGRLHGMGRPSIPMGAVKPSMNRMSLSGAQAKNVPPFRASIRSSRSVLPEDFRVSPQFSRQDPDIVIREQRHFIPQRNVGPTRNPQRPVGRGRPLVARRSVTPGPPSLQSSLKCTHPPSPQISVKHISRPTSPRLSFKHGSPLPMHAFSPNAPPSPLYSGTLPNDQLPQSYFVSPFPNHNASYTSPIHQAMSPYTSDISGAVRQSSPQLSNTLQKSNEQTSQSHVIEQYPEAVVSPLLSNALKNPQLYGASYTSTLHKPGSSAIAQFSSQPSSQLQPNISESPRVLDTSYVSPLKPPITQYAPEPEVLVQSPPASSMLSKDIQNPYLHNIPYKPLQQIHSSPYSEVVPKYDYMEESDPGPLLTKALQNPSVRNASYRTDLRYVPGSKRSLAHTSLRGYNQDPRKIPIVSDTLHNPHTHDATYNSTLLHGNQVIDPAISQQLTYALENPQIRNASYRLSSGTVINMDPHSQQYLPPNLSNAMQNPNLRNASYRLPDGTIITTDSQQPTSPNLCNALQNPSIKHASYRPDRRIITPYQQQQMSPKLLHALQNSNIQNASYRLPDGTVIFTEQSVEPESPALSSALQNPVIRNASYRLGDGTIIVPDYGQSKPTSPSLTHALQNQQMRKARYRLPDGSIITTQLNNEPSVPNLSTALEKTNIRKAAYRLPDGNIISVNPVRPPNLVSALKNEDLRYASYRLPDGSIISPCGKPTSPRLADALKNESLRNATYQLPDGSIISPDPQSHKTNPNVSDALLNPNLRTASYRLPDGSILMQGFAASSSPLLIDALRNVDIKKASYQLPSALSNVTASGVIIGPDGRYAMVSPHRKDPDEHWAKNARERQSEEDVWAAERVLPHGTVHNLTKWSIYQDENMTHHIFPPPTGLGSRDRELQWLLDREGEPTGQWYDKMYSIRTLPTMRYREKAADDGIEDMTLLEQLTEGAVLTNLKSRFEQDIIYTYIGSILLSINPYKLLNIYGTDMVLQYEGHGLGENPPHLFASANLAYTTMMDVKQNQCIIISGESGSGKTEATKLVLRYLTAIHHKRNITQQIEILEAAPLLESFGNAKTVRNDNSSRFGKFVEIYLENGVISGAITTQYLLEKSRIVFQAKNERNYHIFYEMLAGLPVHQRQEFKLQDPETYYYLNQGGNCAIVGKDDGQDFRRLQSAMDILHFSHEDQGSVFRVLSSILHLGNIFFHRLETGVQDMAGIVSTQEIHVIAELLQISPEGLQKAITYKVTEAMKEKIYTPLTVETAVDSRDAVAKILYSLLFHWLTERINGRVYPRNEALSISILDIYGFEDLTYNSFEQLCINYANETLQYFFTKIILKQEQEEYIREQISWKEVVFTDNKSCIELIAAKPHGILRILDDQSCFPQATDHTFLQKCHYHHGENPLYSRPKMPLPEFTVKHYAGRVTYQVHNFLDKNYDQVRQEVLDLFIQSYNRMVSNLFLKYSEMVNQQKAGTRGNSMVTWKHQPSTVAAKFQNSLQELLDKMERCNPLFIRCIKPNNNKEPGLFEPELVATQLRCSGIMDTIHIRKTGYPVRIPFHCFLNRYKALLGLKKTPHSDGDNCVKMLLKLNPVTKEDFQVGVSKIFLKEDLYQLLESKRDRMRHLAALTLQRHVRMYFKHKNFLKFRMNITKLQARGRGYLLRQCLVRKRLNHMKFRLLVRLFVNSKNYIRDRGRRELMNISELVIPSELEELLQTAADGKVVHSSCVAQVEAPKLQVHPQLTLPLDINNHLMTKYIRSNFRELQFGMLTAPLQAPLTHLEDNLKQEALDIFVLILRFMNELNLKGAQENVLGNYIIQRGLANPLLRDEILAQVANQVWRNGDQHSTERGWLLMTACLSSFAPSEKMAKCLLKFVSDYAVNGFKAVCQHKLLHAMMKCQLSTRAARTFPLCLLEWTTNHKKAHMVLQVHCLDGPFFMCPVHSWTTGEDLAHDVLQHRGMSLESSNGWSVLMKETEWQVELGGHEYVMDLLYYLELPSDFPKHKNYFIMSTLIPSRIQPKASLGFDDSEVLLTTANGVSAVGNNSLPIYESHYISPRVMSQRGMDRYGDSFFEPELSDTTGVMATSFLSRRMKGGGGVGAGQSDVVTPTANILYSATLQPRGKVAGLQGKAAVKVLPTMPVIPSVSTDPHSDPQTLMAQQQQAIINQQAVIMAQQMTMQAMAMLTSPISSPPTSPPPTSNNFQPSSPYPAVQPSLYTNFPTSPYAQFVPSSYTISPTTTSNPGSSASFQMTQTSKNSIAQGKEESSEKTQVSTAVKTITEKSHGPVRFTPAAATDVVKYSVCNSEHFVPSHNIKDIIKQYQTQSSPPVPEIKRKEGKVFVKKTNLHDEAMQLLRTQIDVPPPPQRKAPTVESTNPGFQFTKKRPPGSPPRRPQAVSRDLPVESEPIQTSLHQNSTYQNYTYSNVPWKIYIRKEVFYPEDNWNQPLVLDIIFKQIVKDTFSEACFRINTEERLNMKTLFMQHRIDQNANVQDNYVKKAVVSAARESWEIYFSRLFPASGSMGSGIQMLALSHLGIKLLKTVQRCTKAADYFQVLRSYRYADILFVSTPSPNMLEVNLRNDKIVLFSAQTPQIRALVELFLKHLKKDTRYAVAQRNYVSEERDFLSFHKGDIICLQAMDGLLHDVGQLYGCVVKKKVIYLEMVKKFTTGFGWKFGAVMGHSGVFPAEYVTPVPAPEFMELPLEKQGDSREEPGKNQLLSGDMEYRLPGHKLHPTLEVGDLEDSFSYEAESSAFLNGQYNMLEFARKYFRQCGGSKRDAGEMIKFIMNPIEVSLIEFSDPNMNQVASQIFLAIMKFMGDVHFQGQSEHLVLCTFLKLIGEHEQMRDEAYCQVLKQITANTSPNVDSCQKGWRLLYILTAFYHCSEVLKPYLFKFLKDASNSQGTQFQGIAKVCEQNLRKTFQFKGRTVCPSSMELKAIMAGRSSKKQMFLLPGGFERHLKIKTCTVALEVIEELCSEMALQSLEAMDEYTIFIVTNKGQNVRPLTKREYILDAATEAEMIDSGHSFWFRRLIWSQPLIFDNELGVAVHYNQVLPNYLKGLLNVLPHGHISEQQFNQVAKLAALQHRAKNKDCAPTFHELVDYIPAQVFSRNGPQQWMHLLAQHTQAVQNLSSHQARSQFLGLVCTFPMFGSSFFYILSSNNSAVSTPCILAVNQNGLHFLDQDSHEVLLKFPLTLVQSTQTQRYGVGASSPYVNILLGNMTTRKITQIQLEQSLELCRVIAMHVENLLSLQEKRLSPHRGETTVL